MLIAPKRDSCKNLLALIKRVIPMQLTTKMTKKETKAITSLSLIMGLRMLGLFMVLPLFSVYTYQLRDATPLLVGLAMGFYGLCQAIFQIPFGMLSDRFGRKPIILCGLIFFMSGSLLAAYADSIWWMIVARALQGVGAIGSTILACVADLTTEEQRTKAMAISGITIGFSFSIAMFLGPFLTQWVSVQDLFLIAVFCGMVGIIILYTFVPKPHEIWHRDTEPEFTSFFKLLKIKELARLNIGIFLLHAIFTASFIVIPMSISKFLSISHKDQWQIYLPTLLLAFSISLVCIERAERQQQIKPFFLSSILAIAVAECLLCFSANHQLLIKFSLFLFFTGFSILEAFMPSLISRTAPVANKGSALGIYSCSQFFGIFVGGVLGGWLYGQFGFLGVYLFCILLALFWLVIASLMQPSRQLVTQLWRILPSQQLKWNTIATQLKFLPGVKEVTFIREENMAYLKIERTTLKHPDFIHLREQLQSESLS